MNQAGKPVTMVERWLPTSPDVRASASLYLSEAERQGVTPGRRMLNVGREPCPEHLAGLLSVEPGHPVFARRKLMLADDVPVRIAASYFRVDLVEGTPLTAADFVPGGLQGALEALGCRFGSAAETLVAHMPTPYEVETLALERDTPVVRVTRGSYDIHGQPVHTLETVCAADRHVFRVQQVTGADAF